jgi:hypothetical protein
MGPLRHEAQARAQQPGENHHAKNHELTLASATGGFGHHCFSGCATPGSGRAHGATAPRERIIDALPKIVTFIIIFPDGGAPGTGAILVIAPCAARIVLVIAARTAAGRVLITAGT